jgi:hypothetical protein
VRIQLCIQVHSPSDHDLALAQIGAALPLADYQEHSLRSNHLNLEVVEKSFNEVGYVTTTRRFQKLQIDRQPRLTMVK